MIKTTKMTDSLEKHSPFRQKQTFCIIIKVFVGKTVVAEPELSTCFGWESGFVLEIIITKLPESGDLCGNITEFGVAEGDPPISSYGI